MKHNKVRVWGEAASWQWKGGCKTKKRKRKRKLKKITFVCTTHWNWRSSSVTTLRPPSPQKLTPHYSSHIHSPLHLKPLPLSNGSVQENKRCAGPGRSKEPELTQPESQRSFKLYSAKGHAPLFAHTLPRLSFVCVCVCARASARNPFPLIRPPTSAVLSSKLLESQHAAVWRLPPLRPRITQSIG